MGMAAKTWRCAHFEFDLTEPIVMGICNVTPDSFSDGGEHDSVEAAVAFALEQVAAGAQIIDVGGESTRPGADEVSDEEELARVVPVVRTLADKGIAVSVDTRHARVAQAAFAAGACIINDVSGFRDVAMREVAAECNAGLVVMHMKGEPHSMQQAPAYADVVSEVEEYLLRVAHRLEEAGVDAERICLDPGVGFGKTHEHNAALLAASRRLASHGYPLMVAVSRKSYIGAVTGIKTPKGRDAASALCAAAACEDGARIARVHNVKATCAALKNSRRAVVALGANMGNAVAHLDAALAALRTRGDIWIDRVSSYVQSEPAYLEDQDRFVNAVALVQTTLAPEELLDVLNAIENDNGRVRSIANGPRTLDLDIVDYEGVTSATQRLMLPHPKALERDFVVTPLLDIAPGYVLADGTPVTDEHVCVGHVVGLADAVLGSR